MIPPMFATIADSTLYIGAGVFLIVIAWGNFPSLSFLPLAAKIGLTFLGLTICAAGVWFDFRKSRES
ncbi:hypothetical protein [Thermanaerothrix sp.]|uniref:hypothetical protein n=1 Tax=Thermanaerothrix sp. TaxID=2972675 RepID=UPI002ADD3443|nr:hypothetical protein [Thermanaerothrix sp.]